MVVNSAGNHIVYLVINLRHKGVVRLGVVVVTAEGGVVLGLLASKRIAVLRLSIEGIALLLGVILLSAEGGAALRLRIKRRSLLGLVARLRIKRSGLLRLICRLRLRVKRTAALLLVKGRIVLIILVILVILVIREIVIIHLCTLLNKVIY